MSKKTWFVLMIVFLAIIGLWFLPLSNLKPNAEQKEPQKPSTEDNALAAASSDLSLLSKRLIDKPKTKIDDTNHY